MKGFIVGLVLLSINSSVLAKSGEFLRCSALGADIYYELDISEQTFVMRSLDKEKSKLTDEMLSRSAVFQSSENQEEEYLGTMGSKYQIIDTETGEVIARLILDNNGSDGESDSIYPFSARIGDHIAACESTSAPAINYYKAISNLKN